MNREWTADEIAVIRADTAARVSRVVTAAKLGRPVAATRTRALMIGAVMQPHVGWEVAEVERLRALFAVDGPLPTDREIEAATGRKPTSFRPKLVELGLVGPRRFRDDVLASPDTLARRREGVARVVRGTKSRDALAARAARKAERLERKAAAAAAAVERREARAAAAAAREVARLAALSEARAVRAARAEAVAQRERSKAVAVRKARIARPAPARPVVARSTAPTVPAVASRGGTVVSVRSAMRAALDRVAARRIVASPEQAAAAEARLMALLGGG